jgi:hypothetical protein
MKMLENTALLAVVCAVSWPAAARADQKLYPIQQALSSPEAQQKLDPGVKLFFGKRHPSIAKTLGEWPMNRRTNLLSKTDQQGCEYALLGAVLALQDRAKKEGGNAVVKIVSYYEQTETNSEKEYVCDTGALRVGVALKGAVVSLTGR